MTYQIIYSSQASVAMSVDDLEKILLDARSGNEARKVTGVLVYVDGVFLQILEGAKDTVLGLMRNITRDSRHSSVKVIHEAEVDQPMFGSWRMAFLSATPEQVAIWASLEGSASIEEILEGIQRTPHRAGDVADGILRALAG
jgi:hypothetical protein